MDPQQSAEKPSASRNSAARLWALTLHKHQYLHFFCVFLFISFHLDSSDPLGGFCDSAHFASHGATATPGPLVLGGEMKMDVSQSDEMLL